MKKLIAMLLALVMVFALAAPTAFAEGEGKVFNLYAWNEEFIGFLKAYYAVEKDGEWYLPDGVTKINFVITPSDNGAYQQKLDEALLPRPALPTTTRSTCSWLRPTTSRSTPSPNTPRTSPRSA